MKKVSIIVPVYNTELYLSECLDSLINQTYSNIEIILVDDGSKDNSLKLCNEYKEQYPEKIKVISQKNSGVSRSRNNGIKNASGDYVIFVDSDDYCKENMIEELVKSVKEESLITFGYTKKYKNKEIIMKYKNIILSNKREMLENIFLNSSISGIIANKMFSNKTIKKYDLKFDENISYCEDLYFVLEYLKHCKKLINIDEALYYYRMRKSSASFSFINRKNLSILEVYSNLIDEYTIDQKISDYLEYNYLLNYKKLKKVIKKEDILRRDIIQKEKLIINKRSIKEKITYYLIYRNQFIWKIVKLIKNQIYHLYK